MLTGSSMRSRRTLRRHRQRGFTLLEIMIVLTIVGVIIGIAAPLIGDAARKARESATSAHLDLVEDALIVFAQRNGRLPCPAAPDAAAPVRGNERATCTTAATAVGIVPYRTLGLSEDLARDGYKNMITYTIAPSYAATTGASNFCGVLTDTLTINDESGTPVTTELVSFALVSHGQNGAGAFTLVGMGQIDLTAGAGVSSGAFENENADGDAVLVLAGDINENAANGPYDDRLRFKTRNEIGATMRSDGCSGDPESTAKLAVIEQALTNFLRRNGRLPCPGAPNATPLGFERATCLTPTTREGIVPFRTLNITQDSVQDGFGRYFTYQAAENYPALPGASNDIAAFCGVNRSDSNSSLTILDRNGTPASTDPIAVVVLSHGGNGFGHYQVPSNTRFNVNGGDAAEEENADGDTTYIDDTAVPGGYDDVVRWWTRDELANLANPSKGCDVSATTASNLDVVEAALAAYLRRNGRLPCPARPQDTPLGEALSSCSNSNSDDGLVPFRDLGISQSAARDGYGRFFSYHVARDYTSTTDLADFCSTTDDDIRVEDQNGDPVVPSFSATPIVYVLVSHGENGYGHFVAGSSNRVNATGGTPFEDENADNDANFVDAPALFSGPNAGYDDTTRWRTRDNMVTAAGGSCP